MLCCFLPHGLLLFVLCDLCVTVRLLLSGFYCQAVTVRLSCQAVTVRLLQSGCCCQAVAVRLYGLHGVSLSALPAFFPCLFTTKVEVVAAWGLCCILQAFHYRPCLSSQWYASSTVVTVTPPIVAAVTASVPDVDPAVHAMRCFKRAPYKTCPAHT